MDGYNCGKADNRKPVITQAVNIPVNSVAGSDNGVANLGFNLGTYVPTGQVPWGVWYNGNRYLIVLPSIVLGISSPVIRMRSILLFLMDKVAQSFHTPRPSALHHFMFLL